MKKIEVRKFKKTAVTAALAGAVLVAMPAFADSSVSIYGTADVWAGGSKPIGAESSGTTGSGGMQTSYFGLRGSEDLGNNLRAVFALESYMRLNTGSMGRFNGDTFFARSAYVGLDSDNYGRLVAGRTTTPYFISTILFNPLGGSFTFSPSVFHTYANNGQAGAQLIGDSGWSNSVLYSSPKFGGLSFNLQYARGSADRSLGVEEKENGAQKVGGNVLYFNGPFSATLAVQRVNFNSNAGDISDGSATSLSSQRAILAGAAYDFSSFKVYGQYQNIHNTREFGSNVKLNGGQVGVRVPTGQAGAVLASYAHTKTSGAERDRRNTWALAYEHNLSKRTQLYTAYFRDSVSSRGHGNNVGVGIKHDF